jgi:hypothetical protein
MDAHEANDVTRCARLEVRRLFHRPALIRVVELARQHTPHLMHEIDPADTNAEMKVAVRSVHHRIVPPGVRW